MVGLQLPTSHPPTRILQCAGNLVSGWFAALIPQYAGLSTSHPHTAVLRQPGWGLVCSFQPPILPASHPHTAVHRQPGWWLVCSFHPPTLIPQSAGNLVGGWFAATTLPPSYHSKQATWLVVGFQLPPSHPSTLPPSYHSTAGNLVGGWFAAVVQATWLVVGLQLPPSHPHTTVSTQPGWWLVSSFHHPTLPPSHPHTAGNLIGGWCECLRACVCVCVCVNVCVCECVCV